MNSLGGIKFKMHRAVNYVFYAGLIGLGFIIGAGFKFIDVGELISNITRYIQIV